MEVNKGFDDLIVALGLDAKADKVSILNRALTEIQVRLSLLPSNVD